MLAQLPTVALVLWGSATALTLVLLVQIVRTGQDHVYPLLLTYLATNLLQTVIGVALYQGFGFGASVAYYVAWTTQAIVATARAFVAAEVCYLILGKYKGVWGLAARVLICAGLLALSLALYFGRTSFHVGAMTLEIALEAAISTGIAGLFLFARYYQIRVARQAGILGLGLGLLSCCRILNDVVFQHYLSMSGRVWNYLSSGAFVVVLLVWIWAMRASTDEVAEAPVLHTGRLYADVIPSVNRRLLELNEQLVHFWQLEKPKS